MRASDTRDSLVDRVSVRAAFLDIQREHLNHTFCDIMRNPTLFSWLLYTNTVNRVNSTVSERNDHENVCRQGLP